MQRIATEIEATNADNEALGVAAKKEQEAAGIKTITFEGPERKAWLDTARESGWAYVQGVAPKEAVELRKLLTK